MTGTAKQRLYAGSIKHRLYVAQAGVCCYCDKPMLMVGDMSFARFAKLYHLTAKTVKQRVATIEHLIRRADGGTRRLENIALACAFCNSKRQETPWVQYRSQRLREKSQPRWSPHDQPNDPHHPARHP